MREVFGPNFFYAAMTSSIRMVRSQLTHTPTVCCLCVSAPWRVHVALLQFKGASFLTCDPWQGRGVP